MKLASHLPWMFKLRLSSPSLFLPSSSSSFHVPFLQVRAWFHSNTSNVLTSPTDLINIKKNFPSFYKFSSSSSSSLSHTNAHDTPEHEFFTQENEKEQQQKKKQEQLFPFHNKKNESSVLNQGTDPMNMSTTTTTTSKTIVSPTSLFSFDSFTAFDSSSTSTFSSSISNSSTNTAPTSFPFLSVNDLTIEHLMQAQLHLGHMTSKFNPLNLPYIIGSRQGLYVFDVHQTLAHLKRAAQFLKLLALKHGVILFVSNRPDLQDLTVHCAHHSKSYYSTHWRPGTLTNFRQMVLKKANQVHEKQAVLPDVLIFLDLTDRSLVALKEARRMYIPTMALIDSDQNERLVSYPIPGNDDGLPGIQLVAGTLAQSILEGKQTKL